MRSVLGMRLALYGTALVIAGLLLVLRSEDNSHSQLGRSIFHGQTPEGLLVAMTVEDGRAGSAYMRWRMTCESGGKAGILTLRFGKQFGQRFSQRGSAFSYEGRQEVAGARGHRTRYDIRFGGRVSDDGRTIRGHGQVVHTMLHDGRVADTCRSEDVKWTAYRGTVMP